MQLRRGAMSKPRAVFLDALSLGPVDLAPLERLVAALAAELQSHI